MEILKGKEKLKKVTVEDVAFEGTGKQQIFFQDDTKADVDNVHFKAQAQGIVDNTLTDQEKRVQYNKNIKTLDENYSSLIPLGSYIVRMFVTEDEITKSGLILPASAKHFTRSQTKSGYVGDRIPNPFRFTSKAVIVAIPDFEKELKPGQVVQIVTPSPRTDEKDVVDYDFSYIHPDSNLTLPTTNVADPEFGYAIIPRTLIKVIIP